MDTFVLKLNVKVVTVVKVDSIQQQVEMCIIPVLYEQTT